VIEQVINVGETTIVQDAWERGQEVAIHGWIYGLIDGLIRDLEISIDHGPDLEALRTEFLFNDKRRSAISTSN
jgi:carbonic anhydrase